MPLQKVLTAISGYALPAYTFTRSSSGYEVGSNGVLALRSSNLLRIDYLDLDNDGERETPSIVVEMQSTNKFTRSIEFSNSTWVKSGTIVDANFGAAPDLSTQADIVYPSTVNGVHYVTQAALLTASTDHAFTVFASPAGYKYITLRLLNSSGNADASAFFELASSGTVILSTGTAPGASRRSSIDRIRPGIYRCSLVGTISTSTSAGGYIYLQNGSSQTGFPSWAGAGSSGGLGVMLWGGQLEEAMPAETSFIATSAAAASRAADTLYMPFPYIPQVTTLYSKFIERGSSLLTAAGLIQIGSTVRLLVYGGGGVYTVQHDDARGIPVSAFVAAGAVGSVTEIVAWLYADGSVNIAISINGGAWVSGNRSAGAVLASAWTVERLEIGGAGLGTFGMTRMLDVKAAAGTLTEAAMRSLAPFFVIDGIAIPVADGSVREDRVEVGDRARTFDGTNRETVRSQYSVWQAETPPLTVGDRNRVAQALEKSTQPHTSYGVMTRTSTGLLPQVFTRKTGEAMVQSSTDRRYSLAFTVEQSS